MGREARAGKERRARKKAEAWQAGVPTVVTLTEESLRTLRIKLLERTLIEQRATARLEELAGEIRAAMIAAGLDPTREYKISAEKLTAELVVR